MMTNDPSVKQKVIEVLKRRVPAGVPIDVEMWKSAYRLARIEAIIDTRLWKQQNITIERS